MTEHRRQYRHQNIYGCVAWVNLRKIPREMATAHYKNCGQFTGTEKYTKAHAKDQTHWQKKKRERNSLTRTSLGGELLFFTSRSDSGAAWQPVPGAWEEAPAEGGLGCGPPGARDGSASWSSRRWHAKLHSAAGAGPPSGSDCSAAAAARTAAETSWISGTGGSASRPASDRWGTPTSGRRTSDRCRGRTWRSCSSDGRGKLDTLSAP